MSRVVFKSNEQGQILLFPASLDEKVPQDSPARLVNQIVDNLDIAQIIDTYKGGGTSAYHPRMMLKVVLYSYLNNIYSSRKIEQALADRISFMWLSGGQQPDHNTINRFRSCHLKEDIHQIFTQVVLMLVDMGYLSLDVIYVDGTKIESRANRYTFVWKKTVEKNKAKLEEKIRKVLEQIEEGIAIENQMEDQPPLPIDSKELRRRIEALNRENRTKAEQKAIKTLEEKQLPKLEEYEKHLAILGDRNSYSKTDPDATFMRMKEDHMKNGQLKPAYNVQIGTENQFLTHYDFFPNPTDTLTFIPFMKGFCNRYGFYPDKGVADSGYGSEENYEFMEGNEIEPFVKYNYFHKEGKKAFRNNAFLAQNLYYNEKEDYFVCPMGQHMKKVGDSKRKTDSGYISKISIYEAENCNGCPLRCLCHKSKTNRRIEVNHNLNRHKHKVRELLTSPDGLFYRSQRPIEPEAVFGQMKYDKAYNRFRHFGEEKVKADFALFATAFNIGKLWHKINKRAEKEQENQQIDKKILINTFIFILIFRLFQKIKNKAIPYQNLTLKRAA
ncbi:MAG TPA: IS1182 family transposase [bacterium]|jgi:transposase|nr:IS1182 family transposase [bacterium]